MDQQPLITVISFGFLHSDPPSTAHLVVDLRTHFRDPHVSPELRQLTSSHPRVRQHVLATPGISALVDALVAAAVAMTGGPARADVVVAIGCAGGRHRAPTVAYEVASRLKAQGRDVELQSWHITRPVVER